VSGALWTADEAAVATGGTATGWDRVGGVSIDTREIGPGEMFVALAGENRDGHAFVADALAKGAGCAMVTHRPEGVGADAPLLIVRDTLEGLQALGVAARARSDATVIAVTGSLGKTTVKEMLRAMLAAQGATHAAARSFNNHWGVPLTLARMPRAADWAVIEIGMNHAGEITPLTRLARPDVALVTTVAPVHLENFADVAGIADAKAEIFAGLEPGGTAVLPADNEWHDRLAAQTGGAAQLTFGEGEGADLRLTGVTLGPETTVLRLSIRGEAALARIAAPGRHLALNATAALAAALAAGADPARAIIGLGAWRPAEGRGARETVSLGPSGIDGAVILIDESYNASPDSVRAALAVLAAAPVEHDIGRISKGRRIAFLGDMRELGPEEAALHAGLADAPEMADIDRVHCCGPLMRALHDALPAERRGQWLEDSAALAARVPRLVDAGDVCMVKGSNASRMGRVVAAIRALGRPARAEET